MNEVPHSLPNDAEDSPEYYVGRRLSLKGQLLTIRYYGSVRGKPGRWLGVEWDNSSRGKHNGTFDGVRYFECRSESATAASFLRPDQPWSKPRTFLAALQEKYMLENAGADAKAVYFSSKLAQEVGFDKFSKRQAQLHGIRVLVLDQMQVALAGPFQVKADGDGDEIEKICVNITDVDISRSLLESTEELYQLYRYLPSLRRLTLDGNRLAVSITEAKFKGVQYLSVSETLLTHSEMLSITSAFPDLNHLVAANNEFHTFPFADAPSIFDNLRTLDLSSNLLAAVPDVNVLSILPQLKSLVLKHNKITHFKDDSTTNNHSSLENLDLAYNSIASLSVLKSLPSLYPNVKHLRLTGNPVYANLKSAEGKSLAADDGYMLTIARLPQLETLNYSTITEKERLNAETYYLGQIAVELSLTAPEQRAEVFVHHPRWTALCEEYGEPTIHQSLGRNDVDPNSLAARLVKLNFSLPPGAMPSVATRSWIEEVPKSLSIYAILGLVGRRLDIMPLKLRLVWATGEQDPVDFGGKYAGPDWWDSDEEGNEHGTRSSELVEREVDLVAGTRALGTYVEGRKARIRIELKA